MKSALRKAKEPSGSEGDILRYVSLDSHCVHCITGLLT